MLAFVVYMSLTKRRQPRSRQLRLDVVYYILMNATAHHFTIEIKDVSKTYKLGKETLFALRNVNLQIASGQLVGVMGPSGSGKTTLAHIVGGLVKPTRGEVYVGSKRLGSFNDRLLSKFRNRRVGYVFQNFSLMDSYTVVENVALPMTIAGVSKRKRTKAALHFLKLVDMDHKARQRARNLSGGERQRVAIARSLLMRPSVIIADEPTGNLDTAHGKAVIEILHQLAHTYGLLVLLVTHDDRLTGYMDRVIRIENGQVVTS
jgi:putative ABC transport system ATP-binding protein